MFARDAERMAGRAAAPTALPLAAPRLAGTTYLLDRERVARTLGMHGRARRKPSCARNSLDAVSDRDFAIEFSAAPAWCMVHVSRLVRGADRLDEPELGFIRSPTASPPAAIMPQKKNPDVAELARGKTGPRRRPPMA